MRVTVFGASGPIGEACAFRLIEMGHEVVATFRKGRVARLRRLANVGAELISADMQKTDRILAALDGADAALFTPILTISELAVKALKSAGVRRSLFFSSNNVAIDHQAPVYQAIAEAEAHVRRNVPSAIIVRPTLMYGDPELPAVARLCRLMSVTPIFPAPGNALQQPVFFRDVAEIAAALLVSDHPAGTYAVGGPDVIGNVEFYRAVSRAIGGPRVIVPASRRVIKMAAYTSKAMGLAFPLDGAQIARIDVDRVAIECDRLPPELHANVRVEEGLSALVQSMRSRQGPAQE